MNHEFSSGIYCEGPSSMLSFAIDQGSVRREPREAFSCASCNCSVYVVLIWVQHAILTTQLLPDEMPHDHNDHTTSVQHVAGGAAIVNLQTSDMSRTNEPTASRPCCTVPGDEATWKRPEKYLSSSIASRLNSLARTTTIECHASPELKQLRAGDTLKAWP